LIDHPQAEPPHSRKGMKRNKISIKTNNAKSAKPMEVKRKSSIRVLEGVSLPFLSAESKLDFSGLLSVSTKPLKQGVNEGSNGRTLT
jgi:hypothetical protein